MPKHTAVNASDLGGRWDATFHVGIAETRRRVAEVSGRADGLRPLVSPEEIARRIARIPLQDLQPLRDLMRGQATSLSRTAVDRIVAEYPYEALALVERNAAAAADRLRAEIARSQQALDHITGIAEPEAPGDDEADDHAGPRM